MSRSAAVLIDPEVPSTTLDALWRSVEHAQGMDRALEALTRTVPTPDFAIAIREPESVRLLVGGSLQIAVHQPSGSQRVVRASGQEQRAALDDVLWFLRPGGRSDGVALPIVIAVLGLIVASAQKGQAVFGTYGVVTTISVLGSTAFSCLELFVAFLQAYVFTFLSALFIGAATHKH